MVLQRDWCAEHRHDAVAGELAQRPAVTLHHRCGTVQQLGHDLAQPLRPDGRRDVHRMHDIGEQHRHLLVLRRRRAGRVTGAPHSLQNLEFGGSSVPHDPHNSPVAVSPPPPSPLGSTSVSFHRWSTMSVISPSHIRDKVLRLSYVVYFETPWVALGLTAVMASPRPTRYAPRSQAMSPWRGSDPDSRGRRSRRRGPAPAARAAAAARCRV